MVLSDRSDEREQQLRPLKKYTCLRAKSELLSWQGPYVSLDHLLLFFAKKTLSSLSHLIEVLLALQHLKVRPFSISKLQN